MKVIKKGKLKQDRVAQAAKKFKSRVVCDDCKSVLEFNANDLQSYCVPGKMKTYCPVCKGVVEVDEGGLPLDILLYCRLVRDGYMAHVAMIED